MGILSIIDTFPNYQQFWSINRREDLERQIDSWQQDYLSPWPELLQKQIDCYSEDGLSWREVARERVFPQLGNYLPAMSVAHKHLPEICEAVFTSAQARLEIQFDLACVFYVGIGFGAGWATTYQQVPAILFGLEMIAECGWQSPESLSGLTAHELGHLVQDAWRRQRSLGNGSGLWWQLASEGFAQRCEHRVLAKDSWHESEGHSQIGWLNWCCQHRGWLARQFLQKIDAHESVRSFFGSWFEIDGQKQTGYYLGHEVIAELEKSHSLLEIACLEDYEEPCRRVLEDFSRQG